MRIARHIIAVAASMALVATATAPITTPVSTAAPVSPGKDEAVQVPVQPGAGTDGVVVSTWASPTKKPTPSPTKPKTTTTRTTTTTTTVTVTRKPSTSTRPAEPHNPDQPDTPPNPVTPTTAPTTTTTTLENTPTNTPKPKPTGPSFCQFVTAANTGAGFNPALVRASNTSDFLYDNPLTFAAAMRTSLMASVWVNGGRALDLEADAEVTCQEGSGGAGPYIVTISSDTDKATVVRTFTVGTNSATLDIAVTPKGTKRVEVDLAHYVHASKPGEARVLEGDRRGFAFTPAGGKGDPQTVVFSDNVGAMGTGFEYRKVSDALDNGAERFIDAAGARFQVGNVKSGPTNQTVRASVGFTVDTNQAALDTDRDGLPDVWEREGVTLGDGTTLPLHRFGADPNKKDVFLQLNWMRSEWEQLKCYRDQPFDATASGFASLEEWRSRCAKADVKEYRPPRAVLKQLENVFAEQGINLHIFAGSYYSTDNAGSEYRFGGETETYEKTYFTPAKDNPLNLDSTRRLEKNRDRLLGARQSVFHVGVIGDQLAPHHPNPAYDFSMSSGLGAYGRSFYVAKNDGMTELSQLRNTILHEFGHILGLDHSGAVHAPGYVVEGLKDGQEANYFPKYLSTMNYLYQMRHFGFTSTEVDSETSPMPDKAEAACRSLSAPDECFQGFYRVPADWQNLRFYSPQIGTLTENIPAGEQEVEAEMLSVSELDLLAAESKNGIAGLRPVQHLTGRTLSRARTDNFVRVVLDNKGSNGHDFTLRASWPGGSTSQRVHLSGLPRPGAKVAVDVPITGIGGFTLPNLPVSFAIVNQDGKTVLAEEYSFPMINYTAEEAARVREELVNSNDQRLKDAANQALSPDANAAQPAPAPNVSAPTRMDAHDAPAVTRPPAAKPVTDLPNKQVTAPDNEPGRHNPSADTSTENNTPTGKENPTPSNQEQPTSTQSNSGNNSDQHQNKPGASPDKPPTLSTGAIVGIVVGVLAVIGGAAAAFMLLAGGLAL
ncbi:hypothetical protein [Corynebacterium aquatimens]|uniref:Uncharacterized protein n=1 Tax=Corynebacterium aquatimens TaxID=1190508 RepID=A0A931E0E0_9CORY|nr:hypothetical protein [Corynebacterium aquatimens]MBG6122404.1 hypothetical protein [Corynebacterium aquatimens]WJY65056.1 hypothetical protein CAQUA_01605 [Corynebacterium aquatimens]